MMGERTPRRVALAACEAFLPAPVDFFEPAENVRQHTFRKDEKAEVRAELLHIVRRV